MKIKVENNKLIIWTMMLLPIFIQIIYISVYYVNIPVSHDLCFLELMQEHEGQNILSYFWNQTDGQFRNFFTYFTTYLFYKFASFNLSGMIILNQVIMLLSLLGLFKIFKQITQNQLVYFAPISWTFYTLFQYSVIINSYTILIPATVTGMIWSVYFLSKKKILGDLVSIILFAFSLLSSGAGVVLYPVGIIVLAGYRRFRSLCLWGIGGIFIIFLYFYNFPFSESHNVLGNIKSLFMQIIQHFMIILGLNISLPIGRLGGKLMLAGVGIGLLIFCYFIYISSKKYIMEKKLLEKDFSGWFLALLGLAVISLIAIGKVDSGMRSAYASRYIPYTSLIFISLYLLSLSIFSSRKLFIFRWILIIISIFSIPYAIYQGSLRKGVRVKQSYIVFTYNHHTDFLELLDTSKSVIQFMEDEKLSVFKEDYNPFKNIVLHPIAEDKFTVTSKAEILKFQESLYSFTCELEDIQNISIRASANAIDLNSWIRIKLSSNGITLLDENISASQINKDGRIFIELDDKIKACFGKDFVIKLVFNNMNDIIQIPMYDSYYRCATLKEPNYELQDKTIGLEINTPEVLKKYYKALVLKDNIKQMLR